MLVLLPLLMVALLLLTRLLSFDDYGYRAVLVIVDGKIYGYQMLLRLNSCCVVMATSIRALKMHSGKIVVVGTDQFTSKT